MGTRKKQQEFCREIIDMLLMEKINDWIILGNLFYAG